MNQRRDILVIDDEPTITQVVVKVCSAEGFSIAAADHAAAALKYLEENTFRLILCDIMMHELDGFQFLEELVSRGIHTPVVMMTGYSTVENAVRSLSSTGAMDYIAKPFTADELLTVVRRSLQCRKLLEMEESAALPGVGTLSYVACPADYYQLGYVSWVLMENKGTAGIGVSDLFLKAAGDIRALELCESGDDLLQGAPCASVTSVDGTVHEVICPMSGSILEVNKNAQKNPSLVEKDPYFRGWLYRILPSNPASDIRWLTL